MDLLTSRRRVWNVGWAAVLVLAALVASTAGAATINVPGDQPTIQDAIDAAADGDIILVEDGTYAENLTVDKAVTIISVNGAAVTTITANANDTPVIDITVDGVTIGGVGQGFTIYQEDAGPAGVPHGGNCAIRIDGGAVKTAGVTIRDNTIRGNTTDEGILITPNIEGGLLTVRDNVFDKDAAAAFGFQDAIHFHYANYGPPINQAVSAHTAVLALDGNEFTEFDRSGIYFHDMVYNSIINILESAFAPAAAPTGTTYGVYFADDVAVFSTVNMTGATLDDLDYGIYVSGEVNRHSSFNVTDSTATDFHEAAVYVTYLYYQGRLTIDGCTFTGDGAADYGVYVYEAYANSTFTMTNTTVTDFDYAGLYFYYCDYFSAASVTACTFTGNSSTYGIYLNELYYGALLTISDVDVSGFTDTGIWFNDYIDYGSVVNIAGNTITGDSADHGVMIYYGVNDGSRLDISTNTISGFTDTGIWFDYYVDYGSTVNIAGNTITGDSADYGVVLYDIDDGSDVVIADNTIGGFTDTGIYHDDALDYGSTLTITNNTLTGEAADYGIYLYELDGGAGAAIHHNTISGFTDTGIYVDDYVEYGSTLTIGHNTLTGDAAYYGIYFDEYFEYGAAVDVVENAISGFTDYGVYFYDIYEGCTVHCDGNTLTADAGGADYGVYVGYVEYGSLLTLNGNTIAGIRDDGADSYGIYVYDIYDGCRVEIDGNTLTPHADGSAYGIYVEYHEYGSILTVANNTVSDFDTGFFMLYDLEDGPTVALSDNTFTGGSYGLYFDGVVSLGTLLTVERNYFNGFDVAGAYFNGVVEGAQVTFAVNRFKGDGSGIGVEFTNPLQAGAVAAFTHNCFQDVDTGIKVDDILDTAAVTAHYNDFAGTTTGIENVNGDADHIINAEDNYWDAAVVVGEVDNDPALTEPPDEDGDGVPNCADECPGSPAGETVDAGGCTCLQRYPTLDTDGDGTLDCNDGCPNDPNKIDPGICGCGVPDTDTDGDGTPDCLDLCPLDPDKTEPGDCGCGVPDTDTDGDGTPDCLDLCPLDPDKTEPGDCGCGQPEVPGCGQDSDGDGVPDVDDGCPLDPDKTEPGICGCGIPDTDTDGDGVPDCIDNCPETPNPDQADRDGDGLGDACDKPLRLLLCGFPICGFGVVPMVPLTFLALLGLKLGLSRRRRR